MLIVNYGTRGVDIRVIILCSFLYFKYTSMEVKGHICFIGGAMLVKSLKKWSLCSL